MIQTLGLSRLGHRAILDLLKGRISDSKNIDFKHIISLQSNEEV